MYFKSDLADYAREEYLEFDITGQKYRSKQQFSADLERILLALILQPGLSSQASLYFISQGIIRL